MSEDTRCRVVCCGCGSGGLEVLEDHGRLVAHCGGESVVLGLQTQDESLEIADPVAESANFRTENGGLSLVVVQVTDQRLGHGKPFEHTK